MSIAAMVAVVWAWLGTLVLGGGGCVRELAPVEQGGDLLGSDFEIGWGNHLSCNVQGRGATFWASGRCERCGLGHEGVVLLRDRPALDLHSDVVLGMLLYGSFLLSEVLLILRVLAVGRLVD